MSTATNKLTAAEAELCEQIRAFVRLARRLNQLSREITDRPRAEFVNLLQSAENGADFYRQILAAGVSAEDAEAFIEPNWPFRLPRLS